MFQLNNSYYIKWPTCSAADVVEDDVQVGGEWCHLQDILPEADEGLMEQTSCVRRRRKHTLLDFCSVFWPMCSKLMLTSRPQYMMSSIKIKFVNECHGNLVLVMIYLNHCISPYGSVMTQLWWPKHKEFLFSPSRPWSDASFCISFLL